MRDAAGSELPPLPASPNGLLSPKSDVPADSAAPLLVLLVLLALLGFLASFLPALAHLVDALMTGLIG
jgi:hypothetical protein